MGPRPLSLEKRSVTLKGHRTSVALEPAFWSCIDALAEARGKPPARLILEIDLDRGEVPLASALRQVALMAVLSGEITRNDVGNDPPDNS